MSELTDCQMLSQMIGAKPEGIMADIFSNLTDDNDTKLLLAAAPPATIKELAEKTGFEETEVAKRLNTLFLKGLIYKSKKPDGTKYYRVRHVIQMHDATAIVDNPDPELINLWKKYMDQEFDEQMRQIEGFLPAPAARVIPIDISLDGHKTQVLAFDDTRKIFDDARSIAVTKCSCRVIDGACGKPVEVCIQINKAADYAVERGTGRKITKDEALDIMKECAKEGLIPCADNKRSVDMVICNCCEDCCENWSSIRAGEGKFIAPSRFAAVVDIDECSSCEECVEKCFFDAINMDGEGGTAAIIPEKCMGCGVCTVDCPTEALSMTEVRSADHVPK